jgi:signal transduction histidine kinase
MPDTSGLRRKIWIAFILQMAAISFAAVLGVYATATIVEDVIVRRILRNDAEHYLDRAAADPSLAPPDTYFVHGYLARPGSAEAGVPELYRGLAPGYYRRGPNQAEIVYVADSAAGRLYLSFDASHTHRPILVFGSVLCVIIIVLVYLTTWMTYRASRSALSPVIALANAVRGWDPKHPDLDALLPENLPVRADGDVESLAYALHGFATRLEEFVERERAFTRDASHELRTPLTVIKGSADMLLDDDESPPFVRRTAERVLRAVRDMESLIESFLILARESESGLPEVEFSVNDVVYDEIERAQPLCEASPCTSCARSARTLRFARRSALSPYSSAT